MAYIHSLRRLQAILINIVKAESLCVWAKLQPVSPGPAWGRHRERLNFAPTSASAILRQPTDSYS
jgi:hypothetical protein